MRKSRAFLRQCAMATKLRKTKINDVLARRISSFILSLRTRIDPIYVARSRRYFPGRNIFELPSYAVFRFETVEESIFRHFRKRMQSEIASSFHPNENYSVLVAFIFVKLFCAIKITNNNTVREAITVDTA